MADAVTQGRGLLEFQITGSVAHLPLKLLEIAPHVLRGNFLRGSGFRLPFRLFAPPSRFPLARRGVQGVKGRDKRLTDGRGRRAVGLVPCLLLGMAARMEGVTASAYSNTRPSALRAARPKV